VGSDVLGGVGLAAGRRGGIGTSRSRRPWHRSLTDRSARRSALAVPVPSEILDGVSERYQRPGWLTTNVFNRAVAALTRAGLSVAGSRVLEVRGRTSGAPRRTPVNLLTFDGKRYLVSPRGQTQWVRNLRASGEGRLLLGRRTESFAATELADDEKPELLRAYLNLRLNLDHAAFLTAG
jgi:deazaflavin-dependent oxidoreductase (nitroreductase family)